jgi:hypothetical protein
MADSLNCFEYLPMKTPQCWMMSNFWGAVQILCLLKIQCGSEFIREGVRSANDAVGCAGLFANGSHNKEGSHRIAVSLKDCDEGSSLLCSIDEKPFQCYQPP